MKKTIILLLISSLFFFKPSSGQLPGWSNVMKINIDETVLQGTLSDFPVAVILDAGNFDFSLANANGSDIRFTDTLNNLLSFEREIHDANLLTAVYWVRTSGNLLLHFGNISATDAANNTGAAWDANYRAVLHMKDNENNALLIEDSKNNNAGEKLDINKPSETTGKIGPAQEFDGISDQLTVYHSIGITGISISNALTLSAWVNPGSSSPLLDQVTGTTAAYSLRKLSAAYTGSAIRVRRSSDGLEEDIGFNGMDMLDVNALLAHTGSGDGYVVTWYDQSGNAHNVTQAVAASQPMIVENGSVLMSDNKPMVRFNNDYLDGTVNMGEQYPDATINGVWRQTSATVTTSEVPVFLGENVVERGLSIGYFYNPPAPPFFPALQWNNVRLWNNYFNSIDGYISSLKMQTGTFLNNGVNSSLQVYLNGSASASSTTAGALDLGTGFANAPFRLGANADGTDPLSNSYVAEIILFNKLLSSTELGTLEKNQSNTFGFSSPVIAGKGRNNYQLEISNENYVAYINGDTLMTPATPGSFQHVALTYDQTDFNLYVDGQLIRTKLKTEIINTSNNNLFIGAQYTGIIDEVNISGAARSADWIANEYNSGNNTLLVYDQSGFDIINPGQQTAGVEFSLNIANATDFSEDNLEGNHEVSVTSSIPTEGINEDGVLFNGILSFTGGTVTIPGLVLKTAGFDTLTVSIEGISNSETIAITVIAAAPDTLVFITPERSLNAGDVSDTITIQLWDAYGNVATSPGTTTLNLSSTDTSGIFRDADNTADITALTMLNGDSVAHFRYTSSQTGIHVLTVSDNAAVIKSSNQNITVTPQAASKIVIITPEREIAAGDTSDIITIQLQDDFDNPAARMVNTGISLSSDTTGVFRDSLNVSDIEEIIIPAGETEISFRYTSTIAGIHILSIADTATIDALTGDSQELTVNALAPFRVTFITDPYTIAAGDTSGLITIGLLDIYNNTAYSSGPSTIILSSDLTGIFYDENYLEIGISNPLIIADGDSSASFRYSSTLAGIHELSAIAALLEAGTQNITITPLSVHSIAFVTERRTIAAGAVSDTISIQTQDIYGNETLSALEVIINLSSDLTGTFRDLDFTTDITSVTIAIGNSRASFRYTSSQLGSHLLSAQDAAPVDPLPGDTQILTVIPGDPAKILIISDPHTISAGDTSGIITIQLFDAFDNPAVSSGITTVNLSSSLTGIFRDSLNTTDITQVTIAGGDSVASFRYTTTLAGVHVLLCEDAGSILIAGSQELTVNALEAYKIVFITPERTIFSGDTSEIITLQLQDIYNNRAVYPAEVAINLLTSSTGIFLNEIYAPVTSVNVAIGSSEARFHYTSTTQGSHLLQAEDTLDILIPTDQFITVLPPLYIWQGGTPGNEMNWNTAGNWNTGIVPGSTVYIRIPATPFNPVISSNTTIANIVIENGARLTINSPRRLIIGSNGVITIDSGGELISAGTLLISSNATVIIQPGGKVTYSNTITDNSESSTGGIIIESDDQATGSLIQANKKNELISATVQRYMTGNKWHIVAPSVTGQTINSFLTGNSVSYNTNTGAYGMTFYRENPDGWVLPYYIAATTGNLNAGSGYLVRRDNNGIVSFRGNLVNGAASVTLSRVDKGWNALGNPFTSALGVTSNAASSQNFLAVNAVTTLDPSYAALYVWDEPDVRVSGVSYYKIINNVPLEVGRFISPGYIQPGQGFLVKALSTGVTANFTTGMQFHANTATFYKKSASTPWPAISLTAKKGTREASTYLAFNENMTRGLDITYDAGLFGGDPALKIYTRLLEDNGVDFLIQCLPDNETGEMIVPVGLQTTSSGTVIFSAEFTALPAGYKAILEDRQLGVFTDLREPGASYTTGAGSGTGRFFLHVTATPSGIIPADNQKITIFAFEKEIFIQGLIQENSMARVYDLTGKLLKTARLNPDPANLNSFRADELKSGIYIVRIEGKGLVETGKIFID